MHDTCNGVSGGMLRVSEVHTRVALAPWCMHIFGKSLREQNQNPHSSLRLASAA